MEIIQLHRQNSKMKFIYRIQHLNKTNNLIRRETRMQKGNHFLVEESQPNASLPRFNRSVG